MKTTLDIPQELLDEAQEELGFKSKTDVIIFSLRELLRRKRLEGLKALSGKIDLEIDVSKTRKRPKAKRVS